MAATIRVSCVYGAPQGWRWAADINKDFHHPVASLDGADKQLDWDHATDIEVVPGQPHKLQVFMRVIGLHWCAAEVEVEPLKEGETRSYEYRLDVRDRFMNRGQLTRIT